MDLVKQYIVQCIVIAANNLRLSSEKIEVVAMLREHLSKSSDIEQDIKNMKKVTDLSKFVIKLGEIYNYISNSKIDFLRISDKFKEHSHNIVKELSNLLDVVTPQSFRKVLAEMENISINVDLSKKTSKSEILNNINLSKQGDNKKADDAEAGETWKEQYILDELKGQDDLHFDHFEDNILKPIKDLDRFLEHINNFEFEENEINDYIKTIKSNAELSAKAGFDILSNMHIIFSRALELIKEKKLVPAKDVIEGMRSCLIVIVAIVRSKEVNITNYLNKAEDFGRKILNIN